MESALSPYVAAYTAKKWHVEASGVGWVRLRRPTAWAMHIILIILTLGLWLPIAALTGLLSRKPFTLFVENGRVMKQIEGSRAKPARAVTMQQLLRR